MSTASESRTDVLTPEQRHLNMSRIRGADTRPELAVRHALHAAGFRYRLRGHGLPGRPDIVLPRYRTAIFVHGCFWHQHHCHLFKWPRSRPEFWREKLDRNVRRDARVEEELRALGWKVLVIWECALRGREKLGLQEVTARASRYLKEEREMKQEISSLTR